MATGVFALALTANAQAQDVSSDDGAVMRLDRILVTEGRTPVEQAKSGRAFTVITGEELERDQARYVADALRRVPGFAVSRTGSYGGLTQVRVRGAEANHLLVMIDGVEVSETASGEFDFGSLLVDGIDRIEVLRGPQSAFWGSNASAGVVNIITKRGERDGFTAGARTEAGTDGTYLGGVSLGGGDQGYDLAFSGVFRRTGGFNISDFGSEKDSDRNATLNSNFTVDLTPELTFDGTLRYVDRRSDTDAQDFTPGSPTYGLVIDSDDKTATREFFGSVGVSHVSFEGALTQKARFAGSDTLRENFSGGTETSSNEGNRYNGSYQATYAAETPSLLDAFHQVTGGYEIERENFLPSHLTDELDRSSHSLIGEYRGEFLDQLYLNAAVRRDFNDRFADATTYSLSGAWAVPVAATRLHASVGTSITNPTFFEQFGFVPSNFVGNPDLVPEESFGWDVGVEQGFFDGALLVDITYFNQNLTNEIATSYAGPLPTPINLDGESKRQGIEVAATLGLFDGFNATATYTYTDATEQTTDGGARLSEVRRPKHAASFNAAYTFYDGRARMFGEVIFNGEMKDLDFRSFPSSRVTLDAYTVVGIGGSYRLNDNFEAFARIDNLFDEAYEEVFGFNTPGRTAFFGLKGHF